MDTLDSALQPSDIRLAIREKRGHLGPTSGMAPGHIQLNLAILPGDLAFDFLLFCQRNPKPCPLLEVLDAGSWTPRHLASDADLRTDISSYRIYQYGSLVDETTDIIGYWREDFVTFLMGCSFSFEGALLKAGISLPHYNKGGNVSMFVTNIETVPAGQFCGPMVVSMRAVPRNKLVRAVEVTSRFPAVHGSPIHIGEPESIGIHDVMKPDFGDPTEFNDGDVPVFWACGVTPQAVALSSKPSLMITHSPGHMFIGDLMDEDFAVV